MGSMAENVDSQHTLLVVDTDSRWGEKSCEYLSGCGYRPILVDNVQDTIRALQVNSVSAIVLDMFDTSAGMKFLKGLHSHKNFSSIPVVVFTSSEDAALQKQVMALGAIAYASKGEGVDGLSTHLKSCIQDKVKEAPRKDVNKQVKSNVQETLIELRDQIQKEKIELPSQPTLLYRLLTMLTNDSASLRDIGDLVEKEPSIATKVLKAANSPNFVGSKPAVNIPEAVMRIGIKRTLNYVLVINQGQMFSTETQPFKQVREAVWKHSLEVAVTSRYIGEQVGYTRPDNLFAFGLLHDIGKFALIRILMGFPNSERLTSDNILEVINKLHIQLGYTLFAKWGFPKEFVEVVQYHHAPPLKSIHGKHLVITSFANIVAHEAENGGLSENAVLRLLKQPHVEILRFRQNMMDNYKKAMEEEMRELRELM